MDCFQEARIEYVSRTGKHKKEALLQIRNYSYFGITISLRFGVCFQKCRVPVDFWHWRNSVKSTVAVIGAFVEFQCTRGIPGSWDSHEFIRNVELWNRLPYYCCSAHSLLAVTSFHPLVFFPFVIWSTNKEWPLGMLGKQVIYSFSKFKKRCLSSKGLGSCIETAVYAQ